MSSSLQGMERQSEYQRFKQEIIDSQIFDRLKFELGLKNFTKFVKEKLLPIPMDLMHPKLNLSSDLRAQLISSIDIIINCAATVNFVEQMDLALRVNVQGPLKLLKLAQECAPETKFTRFLSPLSRLWSPVWSQPGAKGLAKFSILTPSRYTCRTNAVQRRA